LQQEEEEDYDELNDPWALKQAQLDAELEREKQEAEQRWTNQMNRRQIFEGKKEASYSQPKYDSPYKTIQR
jgi:hypothetical protein